jgi:hypothetical protein
MNDSEVVLQVKPEDGGGFIRLGKNIKSCDRQAEFLKIKIDEVSSSIEKMEKAQRKFGGFVGGTLNFNKMLADSKKFKLQQESMFSKAPSVSSGIFGGAQVQKASFNATPIIEQRAQLEKLQNQYNKLGPVSEKTNTSIGNGWKKNIKTIGRFTWNMFALGSVFALVARAGRSAMETDESYRASTELTTNTLSQLLAPAMKTIINLTQYAVIGIAELVRLFTGYNALAKVTTKNITNASKATKELNRQLFGFDEITKSDGDKTLGLGLAADLKALNQFNDKIDEVRELFKTWGVPEKIDQLKLTLSNFWLFAKPILNWMWEHKEVIAGIFIGWKVGSWLLNIASIIGVAGTGALATTGAVGLAGLAGILVFLGSVAVIGLAIYGANEIENAMVSLSGVAKSTTDSTQKLVDKYKELYDSGKLTQELKATYINSISGMIKANDDLIIDLEGMKKKYGDKSGEIQKSIDETKRRNDLLIGSFEELTGSKWEVKLNAKVDTVPVSNFFTKLKTFALSAGSAVLNALGLGGLANIKIPTFAGGNVATAPTFGMFGEYAGARNNPEITAPQKIMYDTVSKALSNNMGNSSVADKLDELINVMEKQRIINFNMNSRTVEREMQKVNTNFSYNG